ncbi:MAG: C39 family peptidase [Verrucomicrobiota bacterium]|nr:C39 family peptidase [Verrucomicrobiota bacterium]
MKVPRWLKSYWLSSFVLCSLGFAQEESPATSFVKAQTVESPTETIQPVSTEPFLDVHWFTATNLWSLTPHDLLKVPAFNGKFKVESKTDSHFALRNAQPLTFLGSKTIESLLYFKNDQLFLMKFNFYNKGDAGDINRKSYDEMRSQLIKLISDSFSTKPKPIEERPATGVIKRFDRWVCGETIFDLLADREYVMLEVKPTLGNHLNSTQQARANAMGKKNVARADLVKRVKKLGDDVLISDVPMVDQGQKGYCVVAVLERLAQYYNISVDQHMMAKAAKSDAAKGTEIEGMARAARRMGLGNNLTFVMAWDRSPDLMAKAAFHFTSPQLFQASNSEKTKLLSRVKTNIELGIPLIWTVELAAGGERGTLGESGHARLIIGYNEKTQEILYSDSWGRGHELKRMPLDVATSMTIMVMTLKPYR